MTFYDLLQQLRSSGDFDGYIYPAIYLIPSDLSVSFVRELDSFVHDIDHATKGFDVSDTDPAELFL